MNLSLVTLEESGFLAHLSYKYFKRATTLDSLVLIVLVGTGLSSALLMNDTLAIAGDLSILGAASNVIIIHNAEKRLKATIRFLEFFADRNTVNGAEWICLLVLSQIPLICLHRAFGTSCPLYRIETIPVPI
jgi:Na+/H+ antiporter NhaD/arsenite permease-like protein